METQFRNPQAYAAEVRSRDQADRAGHSKPALVSSTTCEVAALEEGKVVRRFVAQFAYADGAMREFDGRRWIATGLPQRAGGVTK